MSLRFVPLVLLCGLVYLFDPSPVLAHPGTLDVYGCHSDKALFGTSAKRECHAGLLAGKVFASTSAEYQAYISAQQSLLSSQQAQLATVAQQLQVCQLNCPIVPPPAGSLTISPNPVVLSVVTGATAPSPFTYTVTNTMASPVTVSYNDNCSVFTGFTTPLTITIPPGGTGRWNLTTNFAKPVGLYTCTGTVLGAPQGTMTIPIRVTLTEFLPPVTGSLTITWAANSEPDMAGYRIYCGKASHAYSIVQTVGKVTTVTVSNLTIGTIYYCAVAAFDSANNESALSAEVSKAAH